MRELARALVPEGGRTGHDYVLIGRDGGIERDFATMRAELTKALRKVANLKPVRAEPVEAPHLLLVDGKEKPSTGSGRTG
jgi:ribonuclease P protein component